MRYRRIRVVATGQFLGSLWTDAGSVFSIAPENHIQDMADALALRTDELDAVESDADPGVAPYLSVPIASASTVALRRDQIAELTSVGEAEWTEAQVRTMVSLLREEITG